MNGWLIEERRLWARRAAGKTCLSALASNRQFGTPTRNDSKGCGAVMRAAPIGFTNIFAKSLEETFTLAERNLGTVALLERIADALGVEFAGLPPGRTLAGRVKAARTRRGWSQEKLAERASVSPMAILRLERGNARIRTLAAVAGVLAPKVRIARDGNTGIRQLGIVRGTAQRSRRSRDRRFTPPDVLERIYAVIGEIDLDPAADRASGVVARRYLFESDDSLAEPWTAGVVFCNPPFAKATAFIRKALKSWSQGECEVVLLLLPARTHQLAFQEAIAGHADVFFLRGRMSFGLPDGGQVEFFGIMLALYGADEAMVARMLAAFDSIHIPRGAAAIGRRVERP